MNKKRLYIALISGIVLLTILVIVAVCLSKKGNSTHSQGNSDGTGKSTIEATDIRLVDKGESAFVVVIPDEAEKYTQFAANEFVKLFREGTGVTLNIMTDSQLDGRTEYVISIGKTDFAKKQGITEDTSSLRMSGSRLVTKGKNLYAFGNTMYGDVNAVYDFMEYTFQYKLYAIDEYVLSEDKDAFLLAFDETEIPNIDALCMMDYELFQTTNGFQYYRAINYYEWWIGGKYAHTYYMILPPETYKAEHPDWYTEQGSDGGLCLSNEEMKAEFVKQVCKILAENPTRNLMMLGQEDGFGFCPCEQCEKRIEELGGFASGVMMEFTNDVVRQCNQWLAENQPDRDVTFVCFAYNATKKPPVVYDNVKKLYKPVSETVVAEDNLSVMFVINFVDYLTPYDEQSAQVNMMDGWSALCDNMTIWSYYTNFSDYMQPFFNFGTIAANYKWLSEKGVTMITDQGIHNVSHVNSFRDMTHYIMASLARDVNLNTDDLVNEFMEAYYKNVSGEMRELYDLVGNHYMMLQYEKGITLSSGSVDIMTSANWSFEFLTKLHGIVEEALEKLEPLKESNEELYETLYQRVYKEGLWIRYYIYTLHPSYLSNAEEYWSVLNKDLLSYGVTQFKE